MSERTELGSLNQAGPREGASLGPEAACSVEGGFGTEAGPRKEARLGADVTCSVEVASSAEVGSGEQPGLSARDSKSNRLQSMVIIGCGLIGVSMALALRRYFGSSVYIDGVDVFAEHRRTTQNLGVFNGVFTEVPERLYDVVVLAVPVDTSIRLLPGVKDRGRFIMDVCSAKQPICDAALALGLTHQFAPTHPMAGKATGGPESADVTLFVDQNWLYLPEWPACEAVLPLILATGASAVPMSSSEEHDLAMAAVSHGVHLASLSTMLAFQDGEEEYGTDWAKLTGPGFRDVTRLSASPPDFWVSTLRFNRQHVRNHLARIITRLQEFQAALDEEVEVDVDGGEISKAQVPGKEKAEGLADGRNEWQVEGDGRQHWQRPGEHLRSLLVAAQQARHSWQTRRGRPEQR